MNGEKRRLRTPIPGESDSRAESFCVVHEGPHLNPVLLLPGINHHPERAAFLKPLIQLVSSDNGLLPVQTERRYVSHDIYHGLWGGSESTTDQTEVMILYIVQRLQSRFAVVDLHQQAIFHLERYHS
jgi:hypothetical protein